jgi:hypothetical protein
VTSIPLQSEPRVVAGPDGQRYELVITGEAELTRGPLGRFLDLSQQIRSEGLTIPFGVAAVLELEQRPVREEWEALKVAYQRQYQNLHEAATVLAQIALVVVEYDPVMQGPAAAVAAMTRIVDIFTDSDLVAKIQNVEG